MESRQLNVRTASERADEDDEKSGLMIVVANFGAVDGVLVAQILNFPVSLI